MHIYSFLPQKSSFPHEIFYGICTHIHKEKMFFFGKGIFLFLQASKRIWATPSLCWGETSKKLTFLTEMSAKGFSPPPPGHNGHMSKNVSFFFIYKNNSFWKFETIFPLPTKTYIFLVDRGLAPHPTPWTDMPAKNAVFFGRLPSASMRRGGD